MVSGDVSGDAARPGKAWWLSRGAAADTLAARNTWAKPSATISVSVRRSDPETGDSRLEAFKVPYQKSMRVLDTLIWISENGGEDLAFRWFCGSKMCGTCAVRMNGREVLSCWEAVEPEMVIEPLRNLPVVRDLVVDRSPFDARIEAFEPWLERAAPYPGFAEPLNHRDMENASKALDCIGCLACYSACPVIGLGYVTNFSGPAPLVQLAQTALDPRNDSVKVESSLARAGIFDCVSCYKCEEVCPAGIPIVTQVIEPLKTKAAELFPGQARHARVFRRIVAVRGVIDPGALVLRVQGLNALKRVARIWRLFLRGKIAPMKTLFGNKNAAAAGARRILGDGTE